MTRYLIPGKSFTRPPRIKTVEYRCKLCLMPGIWQYVVFFVDNKTTFVTFLEAELGFLGDVVKIFKHVPFFCGH